MRWAFAALWSLDPEDAHLAADAALSGSAGHPVPPLLSYMDEVAFWAAMAEPDELKAYALANFTRLSPRDQADFLAHVRGRAAS